MYIEYFAYMYICAPYLCLVATEVREVLDPLGQELQKLVSHRVSAGSQTWIFCKKQQAFSYPLSYFTRPPLKLFVNGKNKQFMYDKHLCFSVHQATTSPGEERKLTLLHISYRYICILSFQLFKDDKDISNSNLNPKPLQFHCRFTERSLMSNV